METVYTWQVIGVIVLVTAFLRFLPFLLFGKNNQTPAIIEKLSKVLSYAIMGMLVVYCLKDITFDAFSNYIPHLVSTLVVVLLHVWKRNTLLSIICATICYMFLVQVVF